MAFFLFSLQSFEFLHAAADFPIEFVHISFVCELLIQLKILEEFFFSLLTVNNVILFLLHPLPRKIWCFLT